MVTKAFFSVKQTIFHSFLDRSLEVLAASHKDNHEEDDHNHHHKHFNTKVSIKEGVTFWFCMVVVQSFRGFTPTLTHFT